MPVTHEQLHAEHRARVERDHANYVGRETFNYSPPPKYPHQIEREAEEWSRTPSKVSDWAGEASSNAHLIDKPVPILALLVWEHAMTFEGLLTAIVGGTDEQILTAAHLMREQFNDWAKERVA